MMIYKDIILEKQDGIATITLNRPSILNALSTNLCKEISHAFPVLDTDNDIRVVILTGSGKAFCAGGDLESMLKAIQSPPTPEDDFLDAIQNCFNSITNFSKPIIAALNGTTCAGGIELTLASDIVLAAKSAMIGDAHANFSVFPGGGSAVRLPRKIPINAANYLLFSGEFVSAQQMKEWGLVLEVVPDNELMASAMKLAKKLSNKSPLWAKRIKTIIRQGTDMPLESALNAEYNMFIRHGKSYDMLEGMKAFSEKRKPEFEGY
ncbi:MAG: enoyl-CoA hydratase [Colwellia sp.]|jgi:enoyl-CoA hydratase